MPTKFCWVIHGTLTSECKASTSPSSFINHSTLLLNRALKHQAPCLYMHFEVQALDRLRVRTRRRVGSTRRRGNHMHDHSRFQRDINDVTGVSLSLPLTKVTDAQYRKRFRASYNTSPHRFFNQTRKLDHLRVPTSIPCLLGGGSSQVWTWLYWIHNIIRIFNTTQNWVFSKALRSIAHQTWYMETMLH